MKKKKLLAVFLSVLVLLGCFPASATNETSLAENELSGFEQSPSLESAIDDTSIDSGTEYTYITKEYISDEKIGSVEEIPSLREENVKHFRLSDGSYEVVSFANPVHRKDKEGIWQDIDNNLTLKSINGKQGYFTEDARVSFADIFKYNSEIFALNENGYTISMVPISSGKISTSTIQSITASAPVITNAQKRTDSKVFESIESAVQIDNKVTVVYNNVSGNTDIEYVLDGNNVKENIIVKAKSDSYEYVFQINLVGLTAELDEAGNIIIRDEKTEQKKYTIPAPFMYDGNGEYSYDVEYELQFVKSGMYLLMVSASEEWINAENRTFPVTIDPTIQSGIWVDTYIDSENPNVSYSSSDVLCASQTKTALIKPYIPSLPINISSIDSAELYISYYGAEDSLIVGLYGVTGMISGTTTYNNAPTISTSKTSSAIIWASDEITESSPNTTKFDITQLFKNWYYSAAIAYGVAIKYYSGSEVTACIKSSETAHAPYLKVKYTQQIPDGVYAIRNEYWTSSWMTVENESMFAGSHIQHKNSTTSPVDTFDTSSLFKISGSDGLYIIRLMTNNNLTLAFSGAEIITKEIPSRDEDVANEDKFSIVLQGSSYMILPYNNENAICLASYSSEDLMPMSRTSGMVGMGWTFEQYTGNHMCGHRIGFPGVWSNIGIVNGTTGVAIFSGWSTYIDANAIEAELRPECEDIADAVWNHTTSEMTITAESPGKMIIDVNYLYSDGTVVGSTSDSFVVVPLAGMYCIQNAGTGKYVEMEGVSLFPGTAIQQIQFYTTNKIKWNLEHVQGEGGYIRLKSQYSNLYIGVDPSSTNLVKQYESNDYTLWMIDRTANGNLKLINKATADSGNVLAVPLTEDLNGTDLMQVAYTADDNYRDEWRMYAILPYTVNVEVIYDNAYSNRYENANTRISNHVRILQEKYLTEFGIIIDSTPVTMFSSYADTACSSDPNQSCTHAENSSCVNSTMAQTPTLQQLHHKNIYNILARIEFPDTTETLKIAYIGHQMCMVDGSTHKSCSYFGIAYSGLGLAAIMNFEEESKSIKTLIHEFGHFYGAPDHYDIGDVPSTKELNAETAGSPYSRDCIYGENKENRNVLDNYIICDGCKEKIKEKISRYNH